MSPTGLPDPVSDMGGKGTDAWTRTSHCNRNSPPTSSTWWVVRLSARRSHRRRTVHTRSLIQGRPKDHRTPLLPCGPRPSTRTRGRSTQRPPALSSPPAPSTLSETERVHVPRVSKVTTRSPTPVDLSPYPSFWTTLVGDGHRWVRRERVPCRSSRERKKISL